MLNKIAIYILLILIYLGLSKSFSPRQQGIPYIQNQLEFPTKFRRHPLSIILVDFYKAGFIIKTYYQRYKLIRGLQTPRYMTVRVSKEFYESNRANLGMSLFSHKEFSEDYINTPMPPGVMYIGDLAYGFWTYKSSGTRVWKFHNAYKHFPKLLGWNDFRPTKDFYGQMNIYAEQEKPFYGLANEFGTEGSVTRKAYMSFYLQDKIEKFKFFKYLKSRFGFDVIRKLNE